MTVRLNVAHIVLALVCLVCTVVCVLPAPTAKRAGTSRNTVTVAAAPREHLAPEARPTLVELLEAMQRAGIRGVPRTSTLSPPLNATTVVRFRSALEPRSLAPHLAVLRAQRNRAPYDAIPPPPPRER